MSLVGKISKIVGVRAKAPELISVVLNFKQPASLTEARIRTAIGLAWGRDVREDLNEHVVNRPPICFVKFDEMVLLLTNSDKPYCPAEYLEQALARFPDERQKKVARKYNAFLTIDLLNPKNPRAGMKCECYRRMAHLAAEFVDDNCLGVYIPETGHMRPYDEDVIKALRSEQPLREIEKW
jgi:hypothetical protein